VAGPRLRGSLLRFRDGIEASAACKATSATNAASHARAIGADQALGP